VINNEDINYIVEDQVNGLCKRAIALWLLDTRI
jgi:hypothetical protein